jgi:hypothetical protein
MKYMLLLYWDQSKEPESTAEEQQDATQPWFALLKEMQAAGVLIANNGLAPVTTATTVRVRDGKTLITDGPFAETHEQLGGFFVLQCQDLDEAIRWAQKVPAAQDGSVEVRPLWSPDA